MFKVRNWLTVSHGVEPSLTVMCDVAVVELLKYNRKRLRKI